jgi:hypothetical protein
MRKYFRSDIKFYDNERQDLKPFKYDLYFVLQLRTITESINNSKKSNSKEYFSIFYALNSLLIKQFY